MFHWALTQHWVGLWSPQYRGACTCQPAWLDLAAQNALHPQGLFIVSTAPRPVLSYTADLQTKVNVSDL